MGGEITFAGDKYAGRFKIEEHSNTREIDVDCEFAYHKGYVTNKWCEGEGMISNNVGKLQRFLVLPYRADTPNVIFNEKTRGKVLSIRKLTDLSLEKMYIEAESSEEIVPKVHAVCLEDGLVVQLLK